MQVKLERSFPIAAPASSAWQLLRDIRAVAECMPGAQITEQIDDRHYKGQVKIKLGPATAVFNGDIELMAIDADKHQLQLLAKGADTKGSSSASMDLTAKLNDVGADSCELSGLSEVTVNGKFASFGGRMMTQVSDQLLKQFAANFSTRVAALGDGVAAQAASAKLQQQPKTLNGLALVWGVIVGFVKGLFSGKPKKPAN